MAASRHPHPASATYRAALPAGLRTPPAAWPQRFPPDRCRPALAAPSTLAGVDRGVSKVLSSGGGGGRSSGGGGGSCACACAGCAGAPAPAPAVDGSDAPIHFPVTAMSTTDPSRPNLPPPELARRQAEWLAPARQWLLQQADLAWRHSVLDLGCGFGSVTPELVAGADGPVVRWTSTGRRCTTIRRPSPEQSSPAPTPAVCLSPIGTSIWCSASLPSCGCRWRQRCPRYAAYSCPAALVAIEPDYGGMIEYPPEIASQDLWIAALRQAGADPTVGRKLPGLLAKHGFTVKVELLNRLSPPAPGTCRSAGWSAHQRSRRAGTRPHRPPCATLTGPWEQIVHLPFVFVTAILPES